MKTTQKKSEKDQGTIDPGNVLLLLYPTIVICLLLVGMLLEARGATNLETGQNMEKEVREGSLLLTTEEGKSIAAPRLSMDVSATVSGVIARVKVMQKFINPSDSWLEAKYIFPLPDESMVDRMNLVVGDRRIIGKIMEKKEAQKTYNRAKAAGKKSSLLVQKRANVFSTRVANIGPGEEVMVEIEYQQMVRLDGGIYSLRFPMVVGPRYIPHPVQQEGKDRENIEQPILAKSSPGVKSDWLEVATITREENDPEIPVQLRFDLAPGFPTAEIVSLYHGIKVSELEGAHSLIEFTGEVHADRDFVLQWKPLAQNEVVTSVFAETKDENQYMSFMLMPPQIVSQVHIPREVVFVLDISGSMAGNSILQAKEAILMALGRLSSADRFNLIVFNNSASSFFPVSMPAEAEHLEKVSSYIRGLSAGGGTEIKDALLLALDGSSHHELLRQVIFLTDGSVANEEMLFSMIRSRLGDSRLFTVGIGSAPNSYFMSRAATMGKGSFTYIGKQSEVKEKINNLLVKLESPVITDLRVSIDKPGAEVEIYPSPLPDLYLGEPLVFAVKSGWENLQLQLYGTSAGKTWTTTVDTSEFGQRQGVATFWARKKIRHLMESLALGEDEKKIRKEVTKTALEHQLMSKYTSLVAVDDRVSRPQTEKQLEKVVKNHLPAGWQRSAIFAGGSQTATPSRLLIILGFLLLTISLLFHLPWRKRQKSCS